MAEQHLTRDEIKRMVHAFLYHADLESVAAEHRADLLAFRRVAKQRLMQAKQKTGNLYDEVAKELNHKEQANMTNG